MSTLYGIFIRELRAQNKITMKQLASSLNISPSYLSSLELGKKGNPSKSLLKKISAYFQLTKKQEARLFESAHYSQRILKIPENLDPEVSRIGNLFVEQSSNLSRYQLKIIEKVLSDIPTHQYMEENKMNTS